MEILHEFEVRKIIEDILIEHQVDCAVEYISTEFYVPMSYSPTRDVIKFNHYNLNGTHYKFFKKMNLNNYAKTIAYHELGHILDIKKNGYTGRDEYDLEVSAWKEAENIIPNELNKDFLKVREKHIAYQNFKVSQSQ